MSITDLPVSVGVGLFVLAALALSLGPYVAVRWRYRSQATDPTITLAGQIAFRIGTLHGLIVALVFADLQGRFNEQRRTAARRPPSEKTARASAAGLRYSGAAGRRSGPAIRGGTGWISSVSSFSWSPAQSAATLPAAR